MIPPGWTESRSADLLEFVTSGSRGWAQYYASEGPLFVRIGNLDHDTIALDLEDVQSVKPPSNAEGERTRLRGGDILISITAELGMVGLVPDGFGEAYINQHIALARPRPGHDRRYLAWFFAGPGKLQLLEMRRGMTKAGLGLDDIRNVQILVPPLNEQRRIVAKLEALQARSRRAREALDAVPPLLEKLRQSILAAAFRGDLTKDWRAKHKDVEPASKLLERIRVERRKKWEEAELAKMKAKGKTPTDDKWKAKYKEAQPVDETGLPELPMGWCWASVGELVYESTYGTSAKAREDSPGVPILAMGNIQDGILIQGKQKSLPLEHDEFPALLLRDGDVLFNRTNSPELVGKTAVFHSASPCSFASYLIRLRAAKVEPELLAFYINSPFGRNWVASVVTQQVGQANVNGTKLAALAVPVPPDDERALVISRTWSALDRTRALRGQVGDWAAAVAQFDRAMLAKAFRGALVPQDPNDEPADVMLSRVRGTNGADMKKPKRARRGPGEASV